MRREIGSRGYLNVETVSLLAGDKATVLTPLACMIRVKCTSVATGASLLYRGVAELPGVEGVPDPTDTLALDANFCDILTENSPDSGWIDVQGSGVRLEAVVDAVEVKVQWTSRNKPVIA
jgi:hypothetical protein